MQRQQSVRGPYVVGGLLETFRTSCLPLVFGHKLCLVSCAYVELYFDVSPRPPRKGAIERYSNNGMAKRWRYRLKGWRRRGPGEATTHANRVDI